MRVAIGEEIGPDGQVVLYAAFRGTVFGTWDTILTDLKATAHQETSDGGGGQGASHYGFRQAQRSLELTDALAAKLLRGECSRLVLCGHSLGGALAQLETVDVLRKLIGHPHLQAAVTCITFAAPYVGSKYFVQLCEQLGEHGHIHNLATEQDALVTFMAVLFAQRGGYENCPGQLAQRLADAAGWLGEQVSSVAQSVAGSQVAAALSASGATVTSLLKSKVFKELLDDVIPKLHPLGAVYNIAGPATAVAWRDFLAERSFPTTAEDLRNALAQHSMSNYLLKLAPSLGHLQRPPAPLPDRSFCQPRIDTVSLCLITEYIPGDVQAHRILAELSVHGADLLFRPRLWSTRVRTSMLGCELDFGEPQQLLGLDEDELVLRFTGVLPDPLLRGGTNDQHSLYFDLVTAFGPCTAVVHLEHVQRAVLTESFQTASTFDVINMAVATVMFAQGPEQQHNDFIKVKLQRLTDLLWAEHATPMLAEPFMAELCRLAARRWHADLFDASRSELKQMLVLEAKPTEDNLQGLCLGLDWEQDVAQQDLLPEVTPEVLANARGHVQVFSSVDSGLVGMYEQNTAQDEYVGRLRDGTRLTLRRRESLDGVSSEGWAIIDERGVLRAETTWPAPLPAAGTPPEDGPTWRVLRASEGRLVDDPRFYAVRSASLANLQHVQPSVWALDLAQKRLTDHSTLAWLAPASSSSLARRPGVVRAVHAGAAARLAWCRDLGLDGLAVERCGRFSVAAGF